MLRPILFSTDLVRPAIEGRKTLTSRLRGLDYVNEKPGDWRYIGSSIGIGREPLIIEGRQEACFYNPETTEEWSIMCPYGAPGEKLWVRETWMPLTNGYAYKADGLIRTGKNPQTGEYYQPRLTWKPSIHMPFKAHRVQLELTGVGVERLQVLTEKDAQREGVTRGIFREGPNTSKGQFQLETKCKGSPIGTYYDGFKFTWFTLNGRPSWDLNPWVWRLYFKLLNCTTP